MVPINNIPAFTVGVASIEVLFSPQVLVLILYIIEITEGTFLVI